MGLGYSGRSRLEKMNMQTLFHITSKVEQEIAERQGWYEPAAFSKEGFIHCAFLLQIEGVVQRYYKGQTGLVLLEIDPLKLDCRVIEENLVGGEELFPHVYGRLPWMAVKKIHDFPSAPDGTFLLPSAVFQ